MNLWNDKHSRSTGHDGAQQGSFQVPESVKIIDESAVSQAAMDRTPTPRPLSMFPLLLFALGRWLLLPLVLDVSPSAWWLVAHKGLVAGKADVEICDDADGNIGRCKEVRGVRTAVELFYMYYIYIWWQNVRLWIDFYTFQTLTWIPPHDFIAMMSAAIIPKVIEKRSPDPHHYCWHLSAGFFRIQKCLDVPSNSRSNINQQSHWLTRLVFLHVSFLAECHV